MLTQLDPSGETLFSTLKANDIGPHLMNLMGVPGRFINTPEEVKRIQDQRAKDRATQQQQLVQQNVDASNAMASGKALADAAGRKLENGV
jgi:hypothetical protein